MVAGFGTVITQRQQRECGTNAVGNFGGRVGQMQRNIFALNALIN